MSDLISRQEAIDASCKDWCGCTYANCLNQFDLESKRFCDGCDTVVILKNLPSAELSQHWVPCSEKLPELNEIGISDMILMCWSDGQITVGAYQGNRTFVGQAWPTAKDPTVTVVAWQPLPEPFKGDPT